MHSPFSRFSTTKIAIVAETAKYSASLFSSFSPFLTIAKAYEYLRKYKGLEFLTKHYGIEHTQSIEDAVEDITIICNRHGGALSL